MAATLGLALHRSQGMRTTRLAAALLLAACTSNLEDVSKAELGVRGRVPVDALPGSPRGSFFEVFLGSTDSSCPTFATPTVTINGEPARLIDSGGMSTSFDFVTSCQPATFAPAGTVDPSNGVTVVVTQGNTRWTLDSPTFCTPRTWSLDLPADSVVHGGETHVLTSSVPTDHDEVFTVTGLDQSGRGLFTVPATSDEPGHTRFTLPDPLPPTLTTLSMDQEVFDAVPTCVGPASCRVRCDVWSSPQFGVTVR